MEQIYVNRDIIKFPSTPPTNHQGPTYLGRWSYRVSLLGLGLLSILLLTATIGLGVSYMNLAQGAAARISALEANITEVSEERDLLSANLTGVMEARRHRSCPEGWTKSCCVCYLLSNQSGSWTTGRDDCRARGADLVVIDSDAKQNFLSGFTKEDAWIGLSDVAKEGTWEWIDGTPLTVKHWGYQQPNNGGGSSALGEEDCGHIRVKHDDWNDLSCQRALKWICETNM